MIKDYSEPVNYRVNIYVISQIDINKERQATDLSQIYKRVAQLYTIN